MYEISKEFTFSASHILEGLPDGHQCGRLHGHNYTIVVVLRGETLNQVGFVRDYGDLRIVKDFIDNVLDHRHLNNVIDIQPSAENLAKHLYGIFKKDIPELYAVRVSETPKTWAEYHE